MAITFPARGAVAPPPSFFLLLLIFIYLFLEVNNINEIQPRLLCIMLQSETQKNPKIWSRSLRSLHTIGKILWHSNILYHNHT